MIHVVASLGTTASVVVMVVGYWVTFPPAVPADPMDSCLAARCASGHATEWAAGLLILTALFLVVQYHRA
jgi:hypothetical protein